MTEVLKECLRDRNVTEVSIATGFWDLRGTALVFDELAEFLSRKGNKFRLLIGKDPYLYSSDTESFTKGRYDKQEQAWRVHMRPDRHPPQARSWHSDQSEAHPLNHGSARNP